MDPVSAAAGTAIADAEQALAGVWRLRLRDLVRRAFRPTARVSARSP